MLVWRMPTSAASGITTKSWVTGSPGAHEHIGPPCADGPPPPPRQSSARRSQPGTACPGSLNRAGNLAARARRYHRPASAPAASDWSAKSGARPRLRVWLRAGAGLFLHLRGVAREVPRGRVHAHLRPAYRHGGLAEAGRDELQLARVAHEVAGAEDARQVRLHLLAHLERVGLDGQSPGLERTQVGDEAEVHDHVVHSQRGLGLRAVVGDHRALDVTV